jgi:hypothetical protein
MSFAVPARAGVRLECENWAYDKHGESSTMTMLIDGQSVRIDEPEGSQIVILHSDGENSEMLILNARTLDYVRIDKDRCKKLFQKLEGIVEQAEAFLETQEKEQRDRMRGRMTPVYRLMLALEAGAEKDKKFKYEKGAEPETLLEIECADYKGFFNKKLYHQVWFAPFDKLEINAEDVQALLDIHESLRGLLAASLPAAGLRADTARGALGMPVRVITYFKDEKAMRFDVREIHVEDIESSVFEVPSEYDEQDFEEWLVEKTGR